MRVESAEWLRKGKPARGTRKTQSTIGVEARAAVHLDSGGPEYPLPPMKILRFTLIALVLPFAFLPVHAATAPAPTARAIDQVARLQAAIKAAGLDGWLFFDFRGTNPIANRVLLLQGGATRRWYYFIPA